MDDLSKNVEKWLDSARTYERRRGPGGTRASIPDDIKIATLEQLVPAELEKHMLLNRSKHSTFEEAMSEISGYCEIRTGASFGRSQANPDAMDIGAFGKGKDKGKSKKGGKDRQKLRLFQRLWQI